MPKYFVKHPLDFNFEVGPALVPPDKLTHASNIHPTIVIADLNDADVEAARAGGAELFSDVQFMPAFGIDDIPAQLKYWDPKPAVGPAGPLPWQTLSLQDILLDIGADKAQALTRGAGATIVIVDSGIDITNLELSPERRSPLSFSKSFADGPWADAIGHGSMVAGISGGSISAGGKFSGVAPDSVLLSARTNYTATDLYEIYDRLLTFFNSGELKNVVINNSYALSACAPNGTLPSTHPYAEIIRRVVTAGIPMVFAAGNNHSDMCCGFPAAASTPNTIWAVNSLDEVCCVGAINWDGVNTVGAHANSSRGPGEWSNKSVKPDLVAPCFGEVPWGSSYRALEWWGTSGAAPLVSGTIALMLSVASASGHTLSPGQILNILREQSDALQGAMTCIGNGKLNVLRSVSKVVELFGAES